jgi:hypothetical protein
MKKKLFENTGGNMFKLTESSGENMVDPNLVKDAMAKLPKCTPTKTAIGTVIAAKSDGPRSVMHLYKLNNGNHAIKYSSLHSFWIFETEADKIEHEERESQGADDLDAIFKN